MSNAGDSRTETPRLGWSINQDSAVGGYGGRREISPALRADVFPRAGLRCTASSTEHVTKPACLPRRDEVGVVAAPKAKARIHRGTMEAAGMKGADTMTTIHMAAVVKAKENGTAGHAQMHG